MQYSLNSISSPKGKKENISALEQPNEHNILTKLIQNILYNYYQNIASLQVIKLNCPFRGEIVLEGWRNTCLNFITSGVFP